MNWLVLVLAATILDSIRIFIDNYASDVYFKDKGAVSQKLFYGWFWVIASIVILTITEFDFSSVAPITIFLIFFSGFLGSFSGIPYYKALEIEESTNLGIFIQLAPILYLVLGWLFLGDTFSPIQLVAFFIILIAPFLIVATTKKRSRKIKLKAVFYAAIYVLIAVVANLIFVKNHVPDINFVSELGIVFMGSGTAGLIMTYCNPKWRKRFHAVFRNSKGKVLVPLLLNSAVGMAKTFCYRAGLVAAPAVALASVASDSIEPIIIFFMGIVLTVIWPKFGREKLNKKTVLVHLVATVLVVIGIVLLQLPNM